MSFNVEHLRRELSYINYTSNRRKTPPASIEKYTPFMPFGYPLRSTE